MEEFKGTQVYSVDVLYFDVVKDTENEIEFIVTGKSLQEIEDKVRKECGEHFISIERLYNTHKVLLN